MLVHQKPCLIVIIALSHFVTRKLWKTLLKNHFCSTIMVGKSMKDSLVLKTPVPEHELRHSNVTKLHSFLCMLLKAVVAGPAGQRAPDHFLGRACFPPCPFFSFRLILPLILFESATICLCNYQQRSLHVSSIDRPSQGVKTLKNYYDTRLLNFIIGRP